jgi:hypothetical protein
MSVSRTFHLSSGALVFAVFLSAAPGVATAQELFSNFQVVSATIDMDTRLPTIIFAVDCLADLSAVELPSTLVQLRGHALARSFQPGGLFVCQSGMTLTVEVTYGFQGGSRFKPGRADLDALLFPNFVIGDHESIVTKVSLHPQK